ncbi:MAG: peptidoglycan-binding domain-containing protein [Candidatus Sulfotelmatobacter sp.]
MLSVGKAACAGIVFLLLATGISGPRSTPLALGPKLSAEVPGIARPDNVIRMQQALQDKGRYHGKLDGLFGLRTRAGIRAYQKAEDLPVTGQLDTQTAAKLGVTAERDNGYEITQGKPSAGIRWTEGSRRRSKLPRKTVTRNGNGTVPPA